MEKWCWRDNDKHIKYDFLIWIFTHGCSLFYPFGNFIIVWRQAAEMPVPENMLGWPLFHLSHLWWARYITQKNQHILSAASAPAGLIVAFLWICIMLLKICTSLWSNIELHTVTGTKTHTHTQSPPRPDTCTHSQHDGIAGVCLVREEKWAEIRSCDPPVCLRLYHSNLTAVIHFKQRQMASGKVRKSLCASLSLIPPSIYIPISASTISQSLLIE